MIYSLELERSALGALLRNNEVFYELPFTCEEDFFHSTHKTIFSVIKNLLSSGEKVDKIIIAEKIKFLGIKFKDQFDIIDYLDSLSFSPATKEQAKEYFKGLALYKIRRNFSDIAKQMDGEAKNGQFSSFNELVSRMDSIYNQTIKGYVDIDEPVNIFETLEETIEERGNNPVEDYGFMTPFPEFNRLYGGLRPKNLYAFASRAGGAKSTLLTNLAFGCHKIDKDIKILYLDTEMEVADQKIRCASAISGVPFWHIDTGNFRKNSDYIQKVRNTIKEVKNYQFYHYQVANKPIEEVVSVIRRWFYSKVKRGGKCCVIYDYLKMTGEKVGQNFGETQIMGQKVDMLKKVAEEINAPILTAIQLNRSGESFNKPSGSFSDDSSAFALTDRLQWFASFTAIFRPKTLDQIAVDGAEFGTHQLLVTKSRFQGRDAPAFNNWVKRKMPDGSERYVANYLNYEVKNFLVSERGSLSDIIEKENHDYDLKDDKNPQEKLLD